MSSIAPRRSRRTELAKGDRRELALLKAAERLLDSGGFESASVAELASAADLSRASFYFYFASKQALLSAVIAAAVADFEGRLADQLAGAQGRSPAEVIADTVRGAADLWWHNRAVLVASVELGSTIPEVHERNMETIAAVGDTTVSLLESSGHITTGVERETTRTMVLALILMTERNFYELARASAPRTAYDEQCMLLTTIWQRALGTLVGSDSG